METENRAVQTTRKFNAPVGLMLEVWTNPEHIINRWGPKGFSTAIHTMDSKKVENGIWRFMDQTEQTIPTEAFSRKSLPLKKSCLNISIRISLRQVFSNLRKAKPKSTGSCPLIHRKCVKQWSKQHKADEGQKQNIERLEQYVAKIVQWIRSQINWS